MSDPTTISDAEVTVTSGPKVIQTTTTLRVITLNIVRNGETVPLINMSVRAAKGLRDMLNTSIAFEEQIPASDTVSAAPLPSTSDPSGNPGPNAIQG